MQISPGDGEIVHGSFCSFLMGEFLGNSSWYLPANEQLYVQTNYPDMWLHLFVRQHVLNHTLMPCLFFVITMFFQWTTLFLRLRVLFAVTTVAVVVYFFFSRTTSASLGFFHMLPQFSPVMTWSCWRWCCSLSPLDNPPLFLLSWRLLGQLQAHLLSCFTHGILAYKDGL